MEVRIQEGSYLSAHELSWALREVTRVNAEVARELGRRLGLGVNDMAALDHLLQDGPLGPAELGHLLGMSSASATALVDRLEAAGHVERRPHATDRRRLIVEPTPHAVEEVLGVIRPLVANLDAVAEELTPDERRVVARYLNRVSEVLGSGSGPISSDG
ncbi:MAG: MarR family winged helix-turn-helix transcriptional regulator [Rubrobacteraceae bacterium]